MSAMEQIRFIQRNGKNILRRDILRILVAVTQSFNVKRCPLSLKFCNLIICISLNRLYVVDNNLHKSVKILISEQYFMIFWADLNIRSKNHSILFLIKKRSTDVQYFISNFRLEVEKQPFADVLQNRCS